MREQQQQRHTAETDEQREDRLQHMREREHGRRGAETDEQTEVRLQRMRGQQQERHAAETEEQRVDRLQHLREQEHERRGSEDAEQRNSRLQLIQVRRQRQSIHPQVVLLDQPSVRSKMQNFHLCISSIEVPTCTTCSEGFPGLTMCSGLNECSRCHRDSSAPKLYSCANNMDPGNVPPELQVVT